MKVRFSRLALNELDAILTHIASHDARAAARFELRFQGLTSLSSFRTPRSGDPESRAKYIGAKYIGVIACCPGFRVRSLARAPRNDGEVRVSRTPK